MKRRFARPIVDCLQDDGALSRLTAHAGQLLKLQRIYEDAVPAALARNSRIANLKLGRVVIHAVSGAVATKLRQLAPRLIDRFVVEGCKTTEILVKVQPSVTTGIRQPVKNPSSIGLSQKQALTSLAESLPEGDRLGAALKRLVERSR
mgnify:CR=1 FL=1